MENECPRPLRLLIVCPSWVGDVAMASPTLALVRRSLPGCFIGGLVRPGLDELLEGSSYFDELHVARSSGVMGPKFVASRLRPRRYDTALLLTNSFSTALITRIAGIPRRIGYDRDARGLLLTDRLSAPQRADGSYDAVPAVEYYLRAACDRLLGTPVPAWRDGGYPLELPVSDSQRAAADELLGRGGIDASAPLAILNPGGNNAAKRWPADRYAAVAQHLAQAQALTVVVNGSPAEAALVEEIRSALPPSVRERVASLPELGVTLGSLKGVIARSRIMVTNDTGPRHVAAASGVRLVTLFGPTDHRWTTIPTRPGSPEMILLADPELPENQLANDHPDRCRVDRIPTSDVIRAVDRQLAGWKGPVTAVTDCRTDPDWPADSDPIRTP
ncbi:MAG: hypothetical protein GIKADHBN_01980 [Phycisphaerales bacterium]|nr:hypothetical protein [Phycisphaerales bacterium]